MRTLLRRYRSTSIRFRVASGAFILGSLLVLVVVQATVRAGEEGLRRQFDDRAETLVTMVATMSREPLLTAEYAQHNELLQQLGDEEDIRTLDLVNISGQIVASSDQSRVGLDSASPIAQFVGDARHPIIDGPVVAVSGEIGTVRIVLDKTAVDGLLAADRRRGLVSGIVGVSVVALVSLIGGWVLTRRVTDLESQLGAVDENGLPYPVRITGNDEIARLGTALNQRTQRIRDAVQATQTARDELQLSETKLQLALAAAADAVVEVDLVADQLTIVGASETGFRTQDLVTTDIQLLRHWVHPDDRGLVKQAIVNAVSGSAPSGVNEVEVRFRVGKRRWRELLLRVQPIDNPTGPSTRVLVAIVDVTEQRLTARHLARTDKMRTIGQLTAGIAHDFNNALAVSRLQLSVLKHPERDRSRDDERIDQLMLANDIASEIVQRLLVSAAPQYASPIRVKIADFVQALSGLLRTILGPGVALILDAVVDDDTVDIDEAATQQVFMNLAKNARDAMQGAGQVTIRTFNPSDVSIAIEVRDTGPGIDPSVAESLFDPFITTKPLGAGTGLGLATAFQTVTTAGGTITASNNANGGASFTVTLPLVLERDAQPNEDSATEGADSTVARRRRILLVDDNAALLNGLTDLLVDGGYEVSPATSTVDALRLAAGSNEFDLLFTDIALPDGSGFDLRGEVAQINPDIRALYMSAILPSDAVFRFGGDAFLQKPFDNADVMSMVASALLGAPSSV